MSVKQQSCMVERLALHHPKPCSKLCVNRYHGLNLARVDYNKTPDIYVKCLNDHCMFNQQEANTVYDTSKNSSSFAVATMSGSDLSLLNGVDRKTHRNLQSYSATRLGECYISNKKGLSQRMPGSAKSTKSQPVFYGARSVSSVELDSIVSRLTRPTVASRGGVDLLKKDFTYIKPKPRKTLLNVPGLDKKFMGLRSVSGGEMKQIVARLTRMTTAYDAKFGPDPNVWIDESPRRHHKQKLDWHLV